MNLLKVSISSIFSFMVLSLSSQQKQMNNTIEELWQKGVASFLNEDDRTSIETFEKLLLVIDKSNTKYYPANFYIAHSYRVILKTTGINEAEADRMFSCYRVCLEERVNVLNVTTNLEVKDFVERKTKSRPKEHTKMWIDTTD